MVAEKKGNAPPHLVEAHVTQFARCERRAVNRNFYLPPSRESEGERTFPIRV
jgi:hypothetical protein